MKNLKKLFILFLVFGVFAVGTVRAEELVSEEVIVEESPIVEEAPIVEEQTEKPTIIKKMILKFAVEPIIKKGEEVGKRMRVTLADGTKERLEFKGTRP